MQAGDFRRIAVVRALDGLGDMLCAVPALHALRRAWPAAEITLVGQASAAPFVARFAGCVDGLVVFPGWPGIPERPELAEPAADFAARMAERRFDLALQMQGDGTHINAFMPLLGAARTLAFTVPGAPEPQGARYVRYPSDRHEIRRLLALLEPLGIAGADERLSFPVREEEARGWRRLADAHGLTPGRFAIVHPGASGPDRRWPAGRFAAVADALAGRGLTVVLSGTGGERAVTGAVAAAMRAPSVDLAGRLPLGVLAAGLRETALLLCNDTGVAHLGAAAGAPGVVVFMVADPGRWAPLDAGRLKSAAPARLVTREVPGLTVTRGTLPDVETVRRLSLGRVQPKHSLAS